MRAHPQPNAGLPIAENDGFVNPTRRPSPKRSRRRARGLARAGGEPLGVLGGAVSA